MVIGLSIGKWSARQDLHLRSLGPKPSALAATLRAVRPGELPWKPPRGHGSCGDGKRYSLKQVPRQDWRTRRELHPGGRAQARSRRQRGALLIELRIRKWWEVLVTLQFVASDFVF